MRILHILSQTELTGAEVYAQKLMEMQHQDGHELFLISDRFHVSSPVPLTAMSISTNRFWQRMQNIWNLRKFVQTNKIQVIHCHSRGAARHAFWAKMGLLVAQVTSLHGRQHFSWSKRAVNIYGDLLIAVCENVRAAHQRNFKTPLSLFRVIRNPFSMAPTSKQNPSAPKIALLGRSSGPKGKRIEDIGFRCFENWLSQTSNLEISVIAPQPERFSPAFATHLAKLNARFPGQIKVLGQIPNLRSQLSHYSLTICSGRIAVESLLEGTPTIACGEWGLVGLVTENNWQESLSSNFGDIGDAEEETSIDYASLNATVNSFLLNPKPVSISPEKLRREFDAQNIHQEIIETYKAAIFKRHVPKWIPALMYHRIPEADLQTVHRIFVTKERFESHLRFFSSKKMTTMTFQDLLLFWDLKKSYSEFPKRPLILTFDDGYHDNLTHLQPLLLKYKMKATIFLLADHSIVENTWDAATGEPPAKLMNLSEKKQLDPTAFEIGSHGFHHLHLNQASESVALKEMKGSREQLKNDLKQEPCAFAYPFGSTNSVLPDLCREAGYRFAVNTDQGGMHLADQPFSIFRVNIFPEDNAWSLRKKTATWYRNYFFRKRHQ